jgi:hypothetical protein
MNSASDELVEAVSVFDAALKKLNLGISAWVQVSGNDDEDGDWWSRDLGYTRVGDTWGIALRTGEGNYNFSERDSEQRWLFRDAPRWMRVEAVGKIPELLESLQKQAEDTTKKIKVKTNEVFALTVAMSKVLEDAQTGQK